jgi:Cu-Zn family superoxide dismutase
MHRLRSVFALALLVGCNKSTPPAHAPGTAPGSADSASDPASPEGSAANPARGARVELQSPTGVVGTLVLRETAEGVAIDGSIDGLTPGAHGFHVHELGDCTPPKFDSAGPHFNPTSAPHAGPNAAAHHAGDLGNIEADESGKSEVHSIAADLSLEVGVASSVIGRAVVVHAKADDLQSQPSGDSGDRIACGVVVADAS